MMMMLEEQVETSLWHWLMLSPLLLIPWEILNLIWFWMSFKGIPESGKARCNQLGTQIMGTFVIADTLPSGCKAIGLCLILKIKQLMDFPFYRTQQGQPDHSWLTPYIQPEL
jgi:hypothetical protein